MLAFCTCAVLADTVTAVHGQCLVQMNVRLDRIALLDPRSRRCALQARGVFSLCVYLARACRMCAPVTFAGYYGNSKLLEDANCSGSCPLGYFCVEGSVLPAPCPIGTYALGVAGTVVVWVSQLCATLQVGMVARLVYHHPIAVVCVMLGTTAWKVHHQSRCTHVVMPERIAPSVQVSLHL